MRQIEIEIDCGGATKQNALKPRKVMANASSKYIHTHYDTLLSNTYLLCICVHHLYKRAYWGYNIFTLDSKRLDLFMVGERIRAARVSVHAGKRISEIMHFNKIYVQRFSPLFSFSVDNLDKLSLF